MTDAVLTLCATVAGKPLRFYAVRENGMARTLVVFEDLAMCLNFSRQQRRLHLRKIQSKWREKTVVAEIESAEVTLAPVWMAEAIVGHERKYGWLAERIGDEFDAALAAAETIAQQERRAA